jgi:lipopolysaccharide transport system ATP-binding protein
MSESVIRVENLSKKFVLSHEQGQKYSTLGDLITRSAINLFSKKRCSKNNFKEDFYALSDLNFEINQGDRVGIIGRNGAGKSTLLKILSRITEPSSGRIKINGRVSSLLEVGTGFHPELTGRENIFLNGAILGMSRYDIRKKFDEIVAFAETEKFLDTPVKRYSSGMYVRLAFAVAAHLEPEILIVDEVLAVGDSQFQKKCLGKMEDVSKGGRTILFVSHNMAAIKQLCNKGILLKNGRLEKFDSISNTLNCYLNEMKDFINHDGIILSGMSTYGGKKMRFTKFDLNNQKKSIGFKEELKIFMELESFIDLSNVFIDLKIMNSELVELVHTSHVYDTEIGFINISKGYTKIELSIENNLQPGNYFITIGIVKMDTGESLELLESIYSFEVSEIGNEGEDYLFPQEWAMANFRANSNWKIIN